MVAVNKLHFPPCVLIEISNSFFPLLIKTMGGGGGGGGGVGGSLTTLWIKMSALLTCLFAGSSHSGLILC